MSGNPGGLNGSTQHFLEVYSQESENLKFLVGVDLSAAPLCPDPTGYSRTGRFSSGNIVVRARWLSLIHILRKFGRRARLGEQPFQILLMLLASPGEMVTREDLRAKLWADNTFVDFDHGLNSAVQRLRDCLSDTAEKPLWVETIPRHGYRFIGQVELRGRTGLPSPDEGSAPRGEARCV